MSAQIQDDLAEVVCLHPINCQLRSLLCDGMNAPAPRASYALVGHGLEQTRRQARRARPGSPSCSGGWSPPHVENQLDIPKVHDYLVYSGRPGCEHLNAGPNNDAPQVIQNASRASPAAHYSCYRPQAGRWQCGVLYAIVSGSVSENPVPSTQGREASLDDMSSGLVDSHARAAVSHTVAVLLGECRGSNYGAAGYGIGWTSLPCRLGLLDTPWPPVGGAHGRKPTSLFF